MTEATQKQERGRIWETDADYTVVEPVGLRLDLGCGQRPKEGFQGVDITAGPGVTHVHDLDIYPWPFEDNSVLEIYCSHFAEHVSDLKRFMEECWRIMKPSAVMQIVGPYYSSIRCWQDFTHVRALSENTFIYFKQPWLISQGLEHYDVKCDFDISQPQYLYNGEWAARSDEAKDWARRHYINVIDDIVVFLRAVKPLRTTVK